MNLKESSYDIIVKDGILASAKEYLNLERRVLIVTDSGVPKEYSKSILAQCKSGIIYTVDAGEESKSLAVFEKLLKTMLDNGFSRKDCVVAVGGGVVGDLSGFVASAYMRGVDFYNIPTTLLSQIDSSIGGKTAVNFCGVKNIVGAFYQPKRVLIDPLLLKTLPERQFSNGLAEAIKMSMTSDKVLFDIIKNGDLKENVNEIIVRSLNIKKSVVEEDEKESGKRKILNFGHTVGHGIESADTSAALYHGECVALGMIVCCGIQLTDELLSVLKKCNLIKSVDYDWEKIADATFHDKKADSNGVEAIFVNEIGKYEIKRVSSYELIELAKERLGGLK